MPDAYDIETQPFTDGTGTSTNYSQPQSEGKMPPLNLARAQHILDRFTEDPSWLANPRTSHAANAIFSAASKVVGMGIQMERVTNMGIATKNLNEFTKQKVDALSKVAAFVPEDDVTGQAELGRLNGMVSTMSTPDFNLQEFSAGVSRLQSRYQRTAQGKEPVFKTLVDPDTGEKVSVVYGPSGAPTVIHPQQEANAKAAQAITLSHIKSLESQYTDVEKKFNLAKAAFYANRTDPAAQGAYNALFVERATKKDELDKAREAMMGKAPSETNAPAATAPAEKVHVVNPDGTKGWIPAAQKDSALQQGYKVIP